MYKSYLVYIELQSTAYLLFYFSVYPELPKKCCTNNVSEEESRGIASKAMRRKAAKREQEGK